jgi:hypothetical protein
MKFWKLSSAAIVLVFTASANAALVGRLAATEGGTDYQAYYDEDADLTWLANANTAGAMNWTSANAWAAGLTINGVSGWRLPDTMQPDASCSYQDALESRGYNCTGSELGNLYYTTLGNTQGPTGNTYLPFDGVQSGAYWSATEYAPDTASAWYFNMGNGLQSKSTKSNGSFYAWAVYSGDVSEVPVPAAVWLFGSGLIGLIGVARRKKA